MCIYRKNPKMGVGVIAYVNFVTLSIYVTEKADSTSDIGMSVETARCQEILIWKKD